MKRIKTVNKSSLKRAYVNQQIAESVLTHANQLVKHQLQ